MRKKIVFNAVGMFMCCMLVIPGITVHATELSKRGEGVNKVEVYHADSLSSSEISENGNAKGILTTKYRVSVSKATMRSGPGANYSSLGTLYKNDVVWVRSISNGWAKFKVNSKWHYIPSSCIKKATY